MLSLPVPDAYIGLDRSAKRIDERTPWRNYADSRSSGFKAGVEGRICDYRKLNKLARGLSASLTDPTQIGKIPLGIVVRQF